MDNLRSISLRSTEVEDFRSAAGLYVSLMSAGQEVKSSYFQQISGAKKFFPWQLLGENRLTTWHSRQYQLVCACSDRVGQNASNLLGQGP